MSDVKKKRGRKSNAEKKLLEESKNEQNTTPTPKKRGRKPKGGKIIEENVNKQEENIITPNIILHLKCNNDDIHNYNNNDSIESFNIATNKNAELSYQLINNNNINNNIITENNNNIISNTKQTESHNPFNVNDNQQNNIECNKSSRKEIDDKLKELQLNLHTNNISDKKSACFWCTYEFDNPPIYIPKFLIQNTYHCYGCFCSPECSVAYLFNENIDSSIKFERYHLSNLIYSKIYNYEKNIKPAPNPYYILDKFYGNLSIVEYRQLLNYDRLLFVIDKPLTRILPELHKDNDDFLLGKNISYNNLKIKKNNNNNNQSKNDIMNVNFGF